MTHITYPPEHEFGKNIDEKYSQKEIRKILKQARCYRLSDSQYSIFLSDNGNLVIRNKTVMDDVIHILPDGSSYQFGVVGHIKRAPAGTCLDIINEAKKHAGVV